MTNQQIEALVKGLEDVFTSINVSDSNGEIANVVDTLHTVGVGAHHIARAITPNGMTGQDASGGTVGSLTEAIMGVAAGLASVADAINHI